MIPLFKVHMPESIDAPLLATLHSGMIGQGEKVAEFERLLAERFHTPYVLTVNSGTSALQLAYRLAGVVPGTDVVTTPMTCTATNMPIVAEGGRIVWADIDPETGAIDPADVERKITPVTKAVACVAWGGYPCDLDELGAICRTHGIALVQDNAHALGAEYHRRGAHEFSDFACYSFQAIKHLTTVDGGLLVCRREADYRRAKLLRWYGIDREDKRQDARIENDIPEIGFKWHMNDVAATIGIAQLGHIDSVINRHRDNADYYDREFWRRDLFRTRPLAYKRDRLSSYWLYTILVDDPQAFRTHMSEWGAQVSPAHRRNDTHSCFAGSRAARLPGVDAFAAAEMCIPVGWWVTDQDRQCIMDAIERWDYVGSDCSSR